MVRKLFVLSLFITLFVTIPLLARESQQSYADIDFTITLDTLYSTVQQDGGKSLPQDTVVVINGAVSSRQIINNGENGPFLAEIKLVSGKWVGTESIEMYSCFLHLQGEEFEKRIPEPRSRREIEDEIELNSTVMVVARVIGTQRDKDGTLLPLLQALHVRPMD
jgi:hypothetical protein